MSEYPRHFRHIICVWHQKSGVSNKLNPKYPENRIIFSATNAPRDPDGRRGADFWCPRTRNQCVEAVFMDALSELRTVGKIRIAVSSKGN